MIYRGGCHCGAIRFDFETEIDPSEAVVRACQCSFCRKHNTRATADPNGHVTISLQDQASVQRYTFGLSTAEYLLCKRCGVYVSALSGEGAEARALVIVNALEDHACFSGPVTPSDYDAETRVERLARRRTTWTPVTVVAASAGSNSSESP